MTPKAAVKSPSSEYERLEEVARPKPVRDLSQAWDERYRPLGEANEVVLSRIRHFCDEKRITLTALECMGTRFAVRNGGAVWLAWAASAQLNGSRIVTAVKSRELGSGQRTAEPGSPSSSRPSSAIYRRPTGTCSRAKATPRAGSSSSPARPQ